MWLKYGCLHVPVPRGRKNGSRQGGGPRRTRLSPLPHCETLSQHPRMTHSSAGAAPAATPPARALPLEQDGAPQPPVGLPAGR